MSVWTVRATIGGTLYESQRVEGEADATLPALYSVAWTHELDGDDEAWPVPDALTTATVQLVMEDASEAAGFGPETVVHIELLTDEAQTTVVDTFTGRSSFPVIEPHPSGVLVTLTVSSYLLDLDASLSSADMASETVKVRLNRELDWGLGTAFDAMTLAARSGDSVTLLELAQSTLAGSMADTEVNPALPPEWKMYQILPDLDAAGDFVDPDFPWGIVELVKQVTTTAPLSLRFLEPGGEPGEPPPPPYHLAVLADAPLVYFRLGEPSDTTMTDSSGNVRNGSYVNSPTLGVAGALTGSSNTAATFNGTTQRGTVTYASWMEVVGAVSLEAWVKTTATTGTIVSRTIAQTPWRIGVVNGHGFFETRTSPTGTGGSTNALTEGTVTVNDGQWHHIVGTWDGSMNRLYVDGEPDGTTAKSQLLVTGTSALSVANRNADSFIAGTADEIAVYGTVLSPARVTAHYESRDAPDVPDTSGTYELWADPDGAGADYVVDASDVTFNARWGRADTRVNTVHVKYDGDESVTATHVDGGASSPTVPIAYTRETELVDADDAQVLADFLLPAAATAADPSAWQAEGFTIDLNATPDGWYPPGLRGVMAVGQIQRRHHPENLTYMVGVIRSMEVQAAAGRAQVTVQLTGQPTAASTLGTVDIDDLAPTIDQLAMTIDSLVHAHDS